MCVFVEEGRCGGVQKTVQKSPRFGVSKVAILLYMHVCACVCVVVGRQERGFLFPGLVRCGIHMNGIQFVLGLHENLYCDGVCLFVVQCRRLEDGAVLWEQSLYLNLLMHEVSGGHSGSQTWLLG